MRIYSIDEAFLGVKGEPDDLLQLGREIRAACRRNVGVPVCVGIAPTTGIAAYSRVDYSPLFLQRPRTEAHDLAARRRFKRRDSGP